MQQDEQQEDEKTAIPLLVLRARSKEYVKKKALKTKGQSANLIEDNYGKDSIVEWMQRTGFGVGINTVLKSIMTGQNYIINSKTASHYISL